MIGQATLSKIAKSPRWQNVKTGVRHFLKRGRVEQYAVGGAAGGAYLKHNPGVMGLLPRQLDDALYDFFARSKGHSKVMTTSAVAAPVIGFLGRVIRTFMRDPRTAKTQLQIRSWEQQLAESHWAVKTFNKAKSKIQAFKAKRATKAKPARA